MFRRQMLLRPVVVLAGVLGLSLAACEGSPAPSAPEEAAPSHSVHSSRTGRTSADFNKQLAALRRLTAPFHNFEKAQQAGWDVQVTPCWDHRTLGAMGYHYGNPEYLEDGEIDLLQPELLIYVPNPSGHMRLVGMEYIVPIDAWDARHDSPPSLLGQEFHPHSTLPIYKLHIWLWRNNPRGMFADWNPKVSCEHAAETQFFE